MDLSTLIKGADMLANLVLTCPVGAGAATLGITLGGMAAILRTNKPKLRTDGWRCQACGCELTVEQDLATLRAASHCPNGCK